MEAISHSLVTGLIFLFYTLFAWLFITGLNCVEVGFSQTKNTTSVLVKSLLGLAAIILSYQFVGHHIFMGEYNPFHWVHQWLMRKKMGSWQYYKQHYYAHISLLFYVFCPAVMGAIISQATAERLKLWSYIFFAVLLGCLLYPIMGYSAWGNGLLRQIGFIDQSGGGVIFLSASVIGLVGNLLMGPRYGFLNGRQEKQVLRCSNLPIAWLGAMMTWVGALGFLMGMLYLNIKFNHLAQFTQVTMNYIAATSAGMLSIVLVSRILFGNADMTLAINGLFTAIAVIATGPSVLTVTEAAFFAIVASLFTLLCFMILGRLKIDDSVGAISSFFSGSMTGLVGIVLSENFEMLLSVHKLKGGFWYQMAMQLGGILVIFVWSSLAGLVAWLIVKFLIGLQAPESQQSRGLDIYDCGILSYPEFTGPI